MKSIKVTCCSCFFDWCVWLSTQADHDIKFEEIKSNKDLFIKDKRYHRILNSPLFYIEYVIACLDCFTFQLWNLTIQNLSLFNTDYCRFNFTDHFSFGEEFDDDIFVGNDQFSFENRRLDRAVFKKIFSQNNVTNYFYGQPKYNSCFASMQVCRYCYFCESCKKLYCKFFEKNLNVF